MDNRISVIVPVYNGERYLATALASIVTQTSPPLEVIVVDDGSTDNSASIARGFADAEKSVSVRYEWQANAGAATARNRGVELARGELLAFLDADDSWVSDKLALQVEALESDSRNDAVFGHMQQFVSPELDDTAKAALRCPENPMPGYTHCTMLIRREAFFRVGLFETNWQVGEFVAWYLKAIEQNLNSVMLPDVVLHRRLHDANQGVSKRDSQTDYVRILKASLDRRRQKAREI